MLVYDVILGVRAKRDRQSLMKNKPQLDDEPGKDADMPLQDVEPSVVSLFSCSDKSSDSSSVSGRKPKSNDVSDAVTDKGSLPTTLGKGRSHNQILDKSKDCSMDSSVSNHCSSADVTSTNSNNRLLTDLHNVSSVTQTSRTHVKRKDHNKCQNPSTVVSVSEHSPTAKSVDCSSTSNASLRNLSCSEILSKKSTNGPLAAEGSHRKNVHGSGLESCSDNVGKNGTCKLLKTVRHIDSYAAGSPSNAAAASASCSDLNAAKSTAASCEQSLDRQTTGSTVTLGSLVEATMHHTVLLDNRMPQPNLERQQPSRIRFEGDSYPFY